jgi:hypothetical protein
MVAQGENKQPNANTEISLSHSQPEAQIKQEFSVADKTSIRFITQRGLAEAQNSIKRIKSIPTEEKKKNEGYRAGLGRARIQHNPVIVKCPRSGCRMHHIIGASARDKF